MDKAKLMKNAYRIMPEENMVLLRVRVPGGHLPAKYLDILKDIATNYGRGDLHLTTRQGFEIPGIHVDKVDEVNKILSPIIEGLEKEIGVDIKDSSKGYPAAGTRNISACIGNSACGLSFCDTYDLTKKIEKIIYPNDYHVKIAISGCPVDCIKAHVQDIGILAQRKPIYDKDKCIGCGICERTCKGKSADAIKINEDRKIEINTKCVGCGECINVCPKDALSKSRVLYNLVIMGRTGRKDPRIAKTFIKWADEKVVLGVVKNLYKYIDKYIDKSLPKEHVGYIFDRTGYEVFKNTVLEGIELNEEIEIAEKVEF